MIQVIHSTTQKARKEYFDDGWEYMNQWVIGGCYVPLGKHLTFAEGRAIVLHRRKANPYRILKGDTYIRQFNLYDGHPYTFRMNKQLFDIAIKYDLFAE